MLAGWRVFQMVELQGQVEFASIVVPHPKHSKGK
jgi:hypothetical protein